MSQEFRGHVGQVSAGDIQNVDIKIHVPRTPEEKGLVPAQRSELHGLRARCEELGADPRDVWRAVHAHLAVKSIDQIRADQFDLAKQVMTGFLEKLMDDADRARLVGKILRLGIEKDALGELNNFCDLTFGRTILKDFKRADLQQVLAFIQEFNVRPLQENQTAPQPALLLTPRLSLRDFLIIYKLNAFGLVALGATVGLLLR